MKEKVIVILGPTATGKSNLGFLLAKKIGSPIISGDSMLVYKGMNIGTAKPSQEELNSVKHYLVDIIEPSDTYSAGIFKQNAKELITTINKNNKIPIVVGGTGLYIKSLLEGYEFSNAPTNSSLRLELEEFASKNGENALYQKLLSFDKDAAERIHPNNVRRVIRAIEAFYGGEKISNKKATNLVYNAVVVGLTADRQILYERINKRVSNMFEQGLVEEVQTILDKNISQNLPAMQGIGYKEVVEYLNKNISFDRAKELVAQNTRNFAKRQLTWYKKMPYIKWYDISKHDSSSIIEDILGNL